MAEEPAKRGKNGRFLPGTCPNPTGRAKIPADVRAMLKAATPDAARLLIDKMTNSKDEKLQIDCAKTIIERVYGKPTQPIDGDLTGGIVITLGGGLDDLAK